MADRNDLTPLDVICLSVGVALISFGIGIILFGPAGQLPIHFAADGTPDDWAGREVVGGIVAALGAGVLILAGGMGRAAARAEDEARRRSLRVNQLISLIALTGVAMLGAGTSLSGAESISAALPMAGTSALFLGLGAFLGRSGPNPFVGIRTPWTYKSRLAWDRANRLAGRLFFLIGLVGLAAAAFAPQPAGLSILIGAVFVAAVASVAESWRVWRADPDRQPF